MNISSILTNLGGFLLKPVGAIHDALRGDNSSTLTSQTISGLCTSEAESDRAIGSTIKYYIGGTFLVTFLIVVFSCGGFAALGKKKRTYTRKRKPATRRRKTMKRRRTYKRKK